MLEPRAPVPTYRIYHLGSNGGIVRAEVIPAADDAEASALARARRDTGPIELWERGRRVALDPPHAVETREPAEADGA